MSRITVAEQMQGIEYQKGKRIASNTFRYSQDRKEVTRLHLTDIAVKDGNKLTLFSGGWRTMTTKDRINRCLSDYHTGFSLWADRGWFIGPDCWNKETAVRFVEGLSINLKTGKVTLPKNAEKEVKAREKLAKRIKSYCDGLKLWLDKNPQPMPNTGDCWYCYFKVCQIAEELQAGKSETARDKTFFGGAGHLEAHLKEKYYHGSLIYCALAWRGYPDPGLIVQMDIKDAMHRAVRDYLKAMLGL